MNKAKVLTIAAGSFFLLSVASGILGFTGALSQKPRVSRADWMAELPDAFAWKDISLPGSHDTLALYGIADLAGQCQSMSLKEQLEAGIRLLDIRLALSGGKLRAVHGFIDQKLTFESAVKTMESFLSSHPKETLFVSVKNEADDTPEFQKALQPLLNAQSWYLDSAMPTNLGAVRGKMVLFSRFQNPTIGIDWHTHWKDNASFSMDESYFVQDEYKVSDVESKKEAIRACLQSETNYRVNFFSGYRTDSFPPSYAPSVAKEINAWAKDTLQNTSHAGFAFFDFVTSDLMDAFFRGMGR